MSSSQVLAIASLALVSHGVAVAQAPSCFDSNPGTGLGAADEWESAPLTLGFPFTWPDGSTSTDAVVTGNGRISSGASGLTSSFAVSPAQFLLGPSTIAAVWADLEYTASGADIEFHSDPVGGFAVFTFRNAQEAFGFDAFSFQVQLNADSSFSLRYDDRVNAGLPVVAAIAGATTGGGASDPGSTDLAATVGGFLDTLGGGTVYRDATVFGSALDLDSIELSFVPNGIGGYLVFGSGCPNGGAVTDLGTTCSTTLQLSAAMSLAIGSAFGLTLSGVPAIAVGGGVGIGFTNLSAPLSVLDPNNSCTLFSSLELVVPLTLGSATTSVSIDLMAAGPELVGVTLIMQGVVVDSSLSLALPVVTSNGLSAVIR